MKLLIADDHELFRDGLWMMATQGFPELGLLEAWNWLDAKKMLAAHSDIVMVLANAELAGQDMVTALSELTAMPQPVSVVLFADKPDLEFCKTMVNVGVRGIMDKAAPRHLIVNALHLIFAGGLYLPEHVQVQALTGRSLPTDFSPPVISNSEHPPLLQSLTTQSAQLTLNAEIARKLTRRQRDIASLLARGMSNAMIANDLDIAEGTVRIHVSAILRALNLSNRSQVAAMAARSDLVS